MSQISALSPIALKARLDQGDAITLLDVREDHEVALCALPGMMHIPLGQIPQRLGEIPTGQPLVVYCHHGGRSARAVAYLQANGLTDIHNLETGIHGWATQVDPLMPTY